MLPERTFRRLDAARLPAAELRRLLPRLAAELVSLAAAHSAYIHDGAVHGLHRASQRLVDTLDQAFELPSKRVFMRDRPRPHRRRGGRIVYQLHGQCDPDGPLEIYTRTAAQARPVALKTLLDTLLHEWVHHYDFVCFGDSVHCTGFYERLGQVYRPLRDGLDAR